MPHGIPQGMYSRELHFFGVGVLYLRKELYTLLAVKNSWKNFKRVERERESMYIVYMYETPLHGHYAHLIFIPLILFTILSSFLYTIVIFQAIA